LSGKIKNENISVDHSGIISKIQCISKPYCYAVARLVAANPFGTEGSELEAKEELRF